MSKNKLTITINVKEIIEDKEISNETKASIIGNLFKEAAKEAIKERTNTAFKGEAVA